MFNNSDTDFETLVLLFRRASSLPELPGSALRLMHVIDSGSASAKDLEKIISADPGLSANLLRISNARVPGTAPNGVSTIRAAIMHLGQRSVRTLAVSLIMQQMSHGKDVAHEFEVDQFAKHSLYTAFLAKYLFARRNLATDFKSQFTADEIFAGGLLHDIGLALLARVSKESYFRIHSFAGRTRMTLDASFLKIYGKPLTELARSAVEAWDLPELFGMTLRYLNEPWHCPDEYTAMCCLNYANYLAQKFGPITEHWECTSALMPEVEAEMALPENEVATVLEHVEHQVAAYLNQEEPKAA
ncbi:MAG TPA: HDOD domain-containing protein [Fimbriimonadaceae bacterium]